VVPALRAPERAERGSPPPASATVVEAAPAAISTVPGSAPVPTLDWWAGLATASLALLGLGSGLVLALAAWRLRRFRLLLRESRPAPPALVARARELAFGLGLEAEGQHEIAERARAEAETLARELAEQERRQHEEYLKVERARLQEEIEARLSEREALERERP
jgi:hypothetical protein